MPSTGKTTMAPYAQPRLQSVGAYRLVTCHGDLDRPAWAKLAELAQRIERDSAAKTVVLRLNVQAACWPCSESRPACEAWRRLRLRLATACFVEGHCYGGAYLLACQCWTIAATPTSRLGLFAGPEGLAGGLLQVLSEESRARLTRQPEWCSAVEHGVVNGEAAETLGIVDDLAPTFESFLAAVDSNSRRFVQI